MSLRSFFARWFKWRLQSKWSLICLRSFFRTRLFFVFTQQTTCYFFCFVYIQCNLLRFIFSNQIQKISLAKHLKGQHTIFRFFGESRFLVWIIEYLSLSYNLTRCKSPKRNYYLYFLCCSQLQISEYVLVFNDTIHFSFFHIQ